MAFQLNWDIIIRSLSSFTHNDYLRTKIREMLHYTNKSSWNAIRSQVAWTFRAHKPPGRRPKAAYFTTLSPVANNLASRLGIPATKTEYVFCFVEADDLRSIPGDRGKFIFFSENDYIVSEDRQQDSGRRGEVDCQ